MKLTILLEGGEAGQEEAKKLKHRFLNLLMGGENGTIKIIVPDVSVLMVCLVLGMWSSPYISVACDREEQT
jgi:hypothetical protein